MTQGIHRRFRGNVCRFLGLLAVSGSVIAAQAFAGEGAEKKIGKNDGAAPSTAFKGSAAAGDKAPIPLELPPQSSASTPLRPMMAHLEPPGFRERPPFLAPKGTVNVSKGKTVTSSVAPTAGKLEIITDGDKRYTDGSVVTLPSGKQWVQIDLGEKYALYAIVMWHYHAAQRVCLDVIVQLADDPEFTKGVKTVFNNDEDNSCGLGVGKNWLYMESYEGKLIDTKGVIARYIRLYSNGNGDNNLNPYVEVEAFGKPAK